MSDSSISDRVKKVVIEQLSVKEDTVTDSASFQEDLNADSLDMVQLLMGFEEEFNADMGTDSIPDEEAAKLLTVSQVVTYIEDKIQAKKS